MQSFIVYSHDKPVTEKYLESFFQEQSIHLFDRTHVDLQQKDRKTDEKKSIGIENIREIQEKLYLKPMKGDFKAIVIHGAENLTIQAQNALLKTLEEPPGSTYIILITSNLSFFLPTVLSRCSLINLKKETLPISNEDLEDVNTTIAEFFSRTVGKKLVRAQKFGENREKALSWIEKTIFTAHQALIEQVRNNSNRRFDDSNLPAGKAGYRSKTNIINEYLHFLKSLQTTYTTIKTTNINPRFALEHLFLNIKPSNE